MDEGAGSIGPGIFWIEFDGAGVIVEGALLLFEGTESLTTLSIEAVIEGIDGNRSVHIAQGKLVLFQKTIDAGATEISLGIFWIKREGAIEVREGFVVPAKMAVDLTA